MLPQPRLPRNVADARERGIMRFFGIIPLLFDERLQMR